MLLRNRTAKSVAALVVIAAYFALAEWSKRSYVDIRPDGKTVFRLLRPYEKFSTSTFGVIAREPAQGSLNELADSVDNITRSPVVIYEDDKPLAIAHCRHDDVGFFGWGCFSHWRGQGYVFSSSDNSDPNTNGRSYWVVIPHPK